MMVSRVASVSLVGLALLSVIGCLNAQEKAITETGEYDKPKDLTCDVGTTIIWTKNGTMIDFIKDKKLYENIPENSTLRVLKVGMQQSGPFECRDSSNNVLVAFQLNVKPYIQPFEKPRNIIQDDPLQIVCNAWGIPLPTITWTHSNNSLGSNTRITFKNGTGTPFPVIENSTIRIEPVEFGDAGNYTCTARNDNGDIATATLVVHVKDKYAALWPFLGICAEVAILCTIILIYEKRRAKRLEAEERQEEAAHLNAPNNDSKAPVTADDVRQRK